MKYLAKSHYKYLLTNIIGKSSKLNYFNLIAYKYELNVYVLMSLVDKIIMV